MPTTITNQHIPGGNTVEFVEESIHDIFKGYKLETHVIDSRDQIENFLALKNLISFSEKDQNNVEGSKRVVFLDCEGSPDLSSSRGNICLLQLCFLDMQNNDPTIYTFLFDIVKGSTDLLTKDLKPLLECENVIKVIHDGRRDVQILYFQPKFTDFDQEISKSMYNIRTEFNHTTKINACGILDTHIIHHYIESSSFNYCLNLFKIKSPSHREHPNRILKECDSIFNFITHENYDQLIDILEDKMRYLWMHEDTVQCFLYMLISRAITRLNVNYEELLVESRHSKLYPYLYARICKNILLFSSNNRTRKRVLSMILKTVKKKYDSWFSELEFEKIRQTYGELLPLDFEKKVASWYIEKKRIASTLFIGFLYLQDVISSLILKDILVQLIKSEKGDKTLHYKSVALLFHLLREKIPEYSILKKSYEEGLNTRLNNLEKQIINDFTTKLDKSFQKSVIMDEISNNNNNNSNNNDNNNDNIVEGDSGLSLEDDNIEKNVLQSLVKGDLSLINMLRKYCLLNYSEKLEIKADVSSEIGLWHKRPLTNDMIRCASLDVINLCFLFGVMMYKAAESYENDKSPFAAFISRSELYTRSFRDFLQIGIATPLQNEITAKINKFTLFSQFEVIDIVPSKTTNQIDDEEMFKLRSIIISDKDSMGRIIGKKGRNFHEIQSLCGDCIIYFAEHIVFILGSVKRIDYVTSLLPRKEYIAIPVEKVGKVIGKGGSNIKMLIKVSGVSSARMEKPDHSIPTHADSQRNLVVYGNDIGLSKIRKLLKETITL